MVLLSNAPKHMDISFTVGCDGNILQTSSTAQPYFSIINA